MTFKSLKLEEYNSELLNLLTQNIPDMLWVKNLDGVYIYANQAICDGLLMAENTKEVIGKNDLFFALREREHHIDKPDWHTFGELCLDSDKVVIANNKAMKFEEYGNVKGKLLYLEVHKAPFYDKEGNIMGVIGVGRDITELKKVQHDLEHSLEMMNKQREQLEYQATHDPLTSLPNRILFMDRLNQAIKQANRNKKKVAILFIDIDNFKVINDTFGHDLGDKVLVQVSSCIREKIRDTDTISRLGGDEFCIVLNELENIDDISILIDKILESLKEHLFINTNSLSVSMSIGISIYPQDGEVATTLLKNADKAMYEAKNEGKDRYCFYKKGRK